MQVVYYASSLLYCTSSPPHEQFIVQAVCCSFQFVVRAVCYASGPPHEQFTVRVVCNASRCWLLISVP